MEVKVVMVVIEAAVVVPMSACGRNLIPPTYFILNKILYYSYINADYLCPIV